MIIVKTFKYLLQPTEEQKEILLQHAGNSRFVYNKMVEEYNKIRENKLKTPRKTDFQVLIKELKKEHDFLKISHSQPLQINAKRILQAISNAWSPEIKAERNKRIQIAYNWTDLKTKHKKVEKAKNYGFPKFKSKNKREDSIFYPQNFVVKKSKMFFAKIGWIKYVQNVPVEGDLRTAIIKQDGNQWFCSISCEIEVKEKVKIPLEKANLVGIDMGVKIFAYLSDGTVIENPRTLKKYEKRLRKESRKLSRKKVFEEEVINPKGEKSTVKKNSKNRDRQIEKVRKKYRKVRNCRDNFLHQTSHYIITKYDGVILENLDIRQLIKKNTKEYKKNLVKGILDVSWGTFSRLLEYKAQKYSKYYHKINKFYPSTIECNVCKFVDHNITLKDRILKCPNCNNLLDRDFRSSLTVRDEGIRELRELYNKEEKVSELPKIPWELGEFTSVENSEKEFAEALKSGNSSVRFEDRSLYL